MLNWNTFKMGIATCALAAMGLFVSHVSVKAAVLVGPNSSANLGGVNLQAQPTLRGPIIASVTREFRTKFNYAGKTIIWSGVLRNQVVRESATGKLTFYYQITSVASNTNNISGLFTFMGNQSAPHLQGSLDVDWRSDMSGTVNPTNAQNAFGSYILFSFQPSGLAPGKTSRWFYIRTNAVNYAMNDTAQLQNSFDPISVYGPAP